MIQIMLVGMSMTFTASYSISLSAMVHELPPEKKNYFQLFAIFVFLVFHKKMVFLERTGDT
jgi:TRAP-type C4-dicarboxylate transport system permease small subunit